ncbi:MAG: methyltransferase domain-containing protein [Planctomycetes bacterium]|nr:methyltransferase domain-containing protein [Planctomycetota bacterium]MCB9904190.1 methyltransferase domain-containing protein [Planctomycetota bacterium]
MSTKETKGYVHGFTADEQDRLYRQARFTEHRVHDRLPFWRSRALLEVGCGVGAQTEILLRHFPELHVTGVDASEENLAIARERLARVPWAPGRYELRLGDAGRLRDATDTYDSAFLCWVLEHVADPALVLSEVRRVLRVGSPIVCTEVQNATFFLQPYSPHTLAYFGAFNDYQLELGGDPFVGAKLGNLLQRVGFTDIVTEVRTIHLDNRAPGERAEFLAYWTELLLSGAPGLLAAGKVSAETVEGMKQELSVVAHDPDAVFFYAFVQARARVG